jgi:hypothetical protein
MQIIEPEWFPCFDNNASGFGQIFHEAVKLPGYSSSLVLEHPLQTVEQIAQQNTESHCLRSVSIYR